MASRHRFWHATLASYGDTALPLLPVHSDERRLTPRLRPPLLEGLPPSQIKINFSTLQGSHSEEIIREVETSSIEMRHLRSQACRREPQEPLHPIRDRSATQTNQPHFL